MESFMSTLWLLLDKVKDSANLSVLQNYWSHTYYQKIKCVISAVICINKIEIKL
jgi:hypothetical protein